MVDARLKDGSRVNAVIPPLALDGPSMSIRRFGNDPITWDDYIRFKSCAPEMVEFLKACVIAMLDPDGLIARQFPGKRPGICRAHRFPASRGFPDHLHGGNIYY